MPITALLTPPGRGAVASIIYDGPVELIESAQLFRAANGAPLGEQPIDQIVFGYWESDPGEEVVLCRTSPTTLEIHCHGGHAASSAILKALGALGCEQCSGWNYLERTRGYFERHAVEALAHAPTPRTAAMIAHQTTGPLRAAMTRLSSEETAADEFHETIDGLLRWASFGAHLTAPWQVVLFGRPNVGKSSLMNALAGFERAIVLDSPGTTRDLVAAELALDGWPIRLTDTAGLRPEADELETSGIDRARRHLAEADLRILVLDRSTNPADEEMALIAEFPDAIIIANKSDLADAWRDALPAETITLSAKTGEGLAMLSNAIAGRIVPGVPEPNVAVPVSVLQVDALESASESLACGDVATARRLCRGMA